MFNAFNHTWPWVCRPKLPDLNPAELAGTIEAILQLVHLHNQKGSVPSVSHKQQERVEGHRQQQQQQEQQQQHRHMQKKLSTAARRTGKAGSSGDGVQGLVELGVCVSTAVVQALSVLEPQPKRSQQQQIQQLQQGQQGQQGQRQESNKGSCSPLHSDSYGGNGSQHDELAPRESNSNAAVEVARSRGLKEDVRVLTRLLSALNALLHALLLFHHHKPPHQQQNHHHLSTQPHNSSAPAVGAAEPSNPQSLPPLPGSSTHSLCCALHDAVEAAEGRALCVLRALPLRPEPQNHALVGVSERGLCLCACWVMYVWIYISMSYGFKLTCIHIIPLICIHNNETCIISTHDTKDSGSFYFLLEADYPFAVHNRLPASLFPGQ